MLSTPSTAQELLGKWVLATDVKSTVGSNNIAYSNVVDSAHMYELSFFSDNTISYEIIDTINTPNTGTPPGLSAGAYSFDYNLDFYVLADKVVSKNSTLELTGYETQPEYQIIKNPKNDTVYYLFYSFFKENHQCDVMCYTVVYSPFNETVIKTNEEQIGDLSGYDPSPVYYSGFSAVKNNNGDDVLYHCGSKDEETSNPKPGINNYTIDSTGITYDEYYIPANSFYLEPEAFMSYQFESKKNTNDDLEFAWVVAGNDSSKDMYLESVYIVKDGDLQIYDLGSGRIGGIEFSNTQDGILYASCTDSGVIRIDYSSLNSITHSIISNSDSYNQTSLQTAPDGKIYGMRNYGDTLSYINETNNTIEAALCIMDGALMQYSANYVTFGNLEYKYHVLPENDRAHNPPISIIDSITGVSCYGFCDGFAQISVYNGHPDYTISCIGPDGSVYPTAGTASDVFQFENLCVGSYSYTITDEWGLTVEGDFVITDDDSYDFPEWVEINSIINPWPTAYDHKSFKKGIIIKAGYTLTIEDITLEFGPTAKILIEPGAILEVDSAILTNLDCNPNYQWLGVDVLGTAYAHQYDVNGENSQGKILLTNEATIEHATCAVKLQNLRVEEEKDSKNSIYTLSGGGIIQATNSHFINNSCAIKAYPYQNYNPINQRPVGDFSSLEQCSFNINNNYLDTALLFIEHVNLSEIDGYSFKTCDFNITETNLENVADTTYGIFSNNSHFSVSGTCIDPLADPCTEFFTSSFSHFSKAISAIGSNSRTYILNTVFEDNKYGVYCDTVDIVSIINSTFIIGNCSDGGSEPPPISNIPYYGVYLNKCPSFIIQYNGFEAASNITHEAIGIKVIESCGENEISHNSFENLTLANHSWGQNFEGEITAGDFGLTYYCNDNYGNGVDIRIENDEGSPLVGGIQYEQGDSLCSTGNSWSNTIYNIINSSSNIVSFSCERNNIPTIQGSINLIKNSPSRNCSSGGGGSSRKSDISDKEVEQNNRATLLPNPADNSATIKYQFSPLSSSAELNIYSMTGVKIYNNIIYKEQGEVEINTQQWANGIYFFTITTKTEIVKGKFVINH